MLFSNGPPKSSLRSPLLAPITAFSDAELRCRATKTGVACGYLGHGSESGAEKSAERSGEALSEREAPRSRGEIQIG